MAEVGVISAIVGLAYAGVQLSSKLYQVGTRTVNASHNINRIAAGVALFSSMLKHVGAVLKDAHSLHSPEALDTAHQIVDECERLYEEIGRIVGQLGGKIGEEKISRRSSITQKVKWHFEHPKVEYLLAQLEYLKTTLSLLIQTLNLATVIAQARREEESEQKTEEIINERIHVETLFIAQRLSLTILNNVQYQNPSATEVHDHSDGSSPSESDHALENAPSQRLLTQEPHRSSSLIHLPFLQTSSNNLSFLDRTSSNQQGPFSPVTQAAHVVDQLLDSWTTLPELIPVRRREPEPRDITVAEEEDDEQHPEMHSDEIPNAKSQETLKDTVPAAEETKPVLSPVEDKKEIPVEMNTQAQNVPVESNTVFQNIPPPPPGPPPELTLQRVESAPESEDFGQTSPATLTTFGYQHGNQFLDIRGHQGHQFPISNMPLPFPLGGSQPPNMRLERSMSAPDIESPPGSRSGPPPIHAMQSYQGPIPIQPDSRGNPISQPYSTSPQYAPSSMGAHTTLSPHPSQHVGPNYNAQNPNVPPLAMPRQPSMDSRKSADEDSGTGLNIPWRIRIGQKYWDFLDAKLVGPRTPYLPTEPASWIYSHDYAHTEVSSLWVCPEAIAELKYPFYEMYHENTNSPNYEHSKIRHFCIYQPLKFAEIEALVNRTYEILHQNADRQRQRTDPQRPYMRNAGQPRSVSFMDAPSRHLRTDSGWEPRIGDRSPRASGEFGDRSAHMGPSPTSNHGQQAWRDGGGRHDDHGYYDDWDEDDNRPPSRGKPRDKARARDYESPKKKKRSTAGTIAKIGGLVAMLDGLDGLIL